MGFTMVLLSILLGVWQKLSGIVCSPFKVRKLLQFRKTRDRGRLDWEDVTRMG